MRIDTDLGLPALVVAGIVDLLILAVGAIAVAVNLAAAHPALAMRLLTVGLAVPAAITVILAYLDATRSDARADRAPRGRRS